MHPLPFETITQFAGLGLTLIAGWFLGLASHSGGRKWRERYLDLEMDNAGYRTRAEDDLREQARRIRDLEAENAKLRAGMPVPAPAPAPAPAPEPEHRHEGHSMAALAGAALAGAAAGAIAEHAAESHAHHAEPVAADHAQPAHH